MNKGGRYVSLGKNNIYDKGREIRNKHLTNVRKYGIIYMGLYRLLLISEVRHHES